MIPRILILALLAPAALAHDFWIEPSTYRPAPAATVTASLRVGMDFAGDPVARSSTLIDSFVVRDASGERPVNGFENQDPAGIIRVTGPAVIGYRSKGSMLEQTPEKFAQFLREEGLLHVVPAPPARGHRERFTRYAKALVGPYAPAKPFGWRFELVPLGTPSSLRLLFEQKPLAGALVTAIARDDDARVSARTDRQGKVTLALPHDGVWLVKATHLVAAAPGSGAEWESLWASVTFER
jgi:hypothetical protein